MTNQPHYFIAIPIENKVKVQLSNWCKQEQPPFLRFVHEQDYHITLVFLGAISFSLLEQLKVALQTVAKRHERFSLTIDDLGTFGQEQSPRIFWASVIKESKLFALQMDIYKTCISLGLKLETRGYSPHITLARKYIGQGPYFAEELRQSFQSTFVNENWCASSFVIYQTHLKKTPKYEVVTSFSLLLS